MKWVLLFLLLLGVLGLGPKWRKGFVDCPDCRGSPSQDHPLLAGVGWECESCQGRGCVAQEQSDG